MGQDHSPVETSFPHLNIGVQLHSQTSSEAWMHRNWYCDHTTEFIRDRGGLLTRCDIIQIDEHRGMPIEVPILEVYCILVDRNRIEVSCIVLVHLVLEDRGILQVFLKGRERCQGTHSDSSPAQPGSTAFAQSRCMRRASYRPAWSAHPCRWSPRPPLPPPTSVFLPPSCSPPCSPSSPRPPPSILCEERDAPDWVQGHARTQYTTCWGLTSGMLLTCATFLLTSLNGPVAFISRRACTGQLLHMGGQHSLLSGRATHPRNIQHTTKSTPADLSDV